MDKKAPFGVDLLLPAVGGNARKTNKDCALLNVLCPIRRPRSTDPTCQTREESSPSWSIFALRRRLRSLYAQLEVRRMRHEVLRWIPEPCSQSRPHGL